jgi:hypothetical protein
MSRVFKILMLMASIALTACVPPKSESQKFAEKATSPFVSPEVTNAPVIQTEPFLHLFDSADGLPVTTKEKCVEDVCGAPPSEPLIDSAIKAAADHMMESLTPKIQSAILDSNKSTTTLRNKIVSLKDQISHTQLDPRHAAFVNFLWALPYSKVIASAWVNETHKYDHAKVVKLLPDLSTSDVQFVEAILNAYIGSDDMIAADSISEEGLMIYFGRQTKSEDLATIRNAAKSYAQKVRARIEGIKSAFPTLPVTLDPATTALINGRDLDSAETGRFVSDIRSASFDAIYGKNLALNTQFEPDLAGQVDTFMSSTLPMFDKQLAPESVAAETKRTLQACRRVSTNISRLKMNEAKSLSNMRPMVDAVRAQVLKTVDDFTTDENRQISLHQKLSAVQFATPDSADQLFKKIVLKLDDEIASAKDETNWTQTGGLQDLVLEIGAANLTLSNRDKSMADVCDNRDPDLLIDHSISSMGFITLSWPTLADPVSGYGIIAHEFGHIVSAALKDLKIANGNADPTSYSNIYDCVQKRQSGKNSLSTQEEDFADRFAAHVLKDSEANASGPANFGCLILKQGSVTRYGKSGGLSMRWPSEYEYPHSPDLYRLLQIEIDRGRALPVTCQGIVGQSYPAMTNQCLF